MSNTFLGNFFSFHKQLCSTSQAVDSFCVHMFNKVVDFSVCTVQLGKIKKNEIHDDLSQTVPQATITEQFLFFQMNEKDCVILLFSKKIRRVFVKCRMINTLS